MKVNFAAFAYEQDQSLGITTANLIVLGFA